MKNKIIINLIVNTELEEKELFDKFKQVCAENFQDFELIINQLKYKNKD